MRNLIGATVIAAAVATLVSAATVGAQPQRGPGGLGGPGGRGRGGPPVPMMLLDENCDGNLDQGEIARAPQNLLKLDRNGDGMLTRDELRPPRPEDGQPPPNPPCGPDVQQQQPRQ
jgi:hypothetical protein